MTSDDAGVGERIGRSQPPEARALAYKTLRWAGALLAVAGSALAFLIMAMDARSRVSVPLGAAGCAAASLGVLAALGMFEPSEAGVSSRVKASRLGLRIIEAFSGLLSLILVLRFAVAGTLPWPVTSAALLVTGAFFWLLIASFRVARAIGALGDTPLLERHGFWLMAVTAVLYLPLLGSYSLIDPWETHYGEVAREILARGDWISLWWAQDGWFWSKPVLDFWVQALSFSLLGVQYLPDRMVASAAFGHVPHPEWAARMPVFLMTLAGDYLLYKGVSKVYGRQVGLVSGLVLVTTPYWFFLTHQTMTDMPYVAPLTGALGLFLIGFHTHPEERVRVYELRVLGVPLRLSAQHLLWSVVLICTVPQILYLLSRNLTWIVEGEPRFLFRPHLDLFFAGSGPTEGGGNCGLPGNQACAPVTPFYRAAWVQPSAMALLWTAVLGALLWSYRGERRVQRLAFVGAWFCVALSALAKGAPGLVIPAASVAAYVAATRRWRDVLRLELLAAALLLFSVALPWYVQSVVRHGPPFVDRLFFHDMYKRAFVHVHDTNVGVDVTFRYYVWQLGYGLFPWTGLSAAGLLWWLRSREDRARGDAAVLLVLWFLTAFGMFTITLTKFHHYILPVVPPIAVLCGVVVVRAMRVEAPVRGLRRAARIALTLLGTVLLLLAALPGGSGAFLLGVPADVSPRLGAQLLPGVLGLLCIVAAGWIAALTPRRDVGDEDGETSEDALAPGAQAHDAAMLGALGLASFVAVLLVGRDLTTTFEGDVEGQLRLLQLFTYNYGRQWPASVDFRPALLAFSAVAVFASAAWVVRRWRAQASLVLLAVSVVWAAWGTNVYLVKAAPHWGQRETIVEYYRRRAGPEEPLVAYQMNWKGENFYTGNRLPAFVSDPKGFKAWVSRQREGGERVIFVTTEHGRVASLKTELGSYEDFELLTNKELNNKFVLARVVL